MYEKKTETELQHPVRSVMSCENIELLIVLKFRFDDHKI